MKHYSVRMNDSERRLWVLNDEGLYNWYRHSHLSMTRFIRENRADITTYILQALGEDTSTTPKPATRY